MVHKNWPIYSLLYPEFRAILCTIFVHIDIPKSKNTLLTPTSFLLQKGKQYSTKDKEVRVSLISGLRLLPPNC